MALVSQKELQEKTEYERTSDIIKWLRNHGVKYWICKGGKVFTTDKAINNALLGDAANDGELEFL